MSRSIPLHASYLLACLLSLAVSSCGPGGVPTAVFKETDLANTSQAMQSKGNVDITVLPLKPSAMYQYPDLFSFSKDRLMGDFSGLALDSWFPEDYQKTRWNYTFAPGEKILVAFKVKVKNGTSHILRMKDARVYLMMEGQDPIQAVTLLGNTTLVNASPQGKEAVLLPKSYVEGDGSLVDWVTREEQEYERTRKKGLISTGYPIGLGAQTIAQNQRNYKLINDVGREILPNTTFDGLLVFPVYTASIQDAKLMFYDITTKTDAAGNPSEKVTFEYPIKVVDQQMWFDREQEKRWKTGIPGTTGSN